MKEPSKNMLQTSGERYKNFTIPPYGSIVIINCDVDGSLYIDGYRDEILASKYNARPEKFKAWDRYSVYPVMADYPIYENFQTAIDMTRKFGNPCRANYYIFFSIVDVEETKKQIAIGKFSDVTAASYNWLDICELDYTNERARKYLSTKVSPLTKAKMQQIRLAAQQTTTPATTLSASSSRFLTSASNSNLATESSVSNISSTNLETKVKYKKGCCTIL